MKNEYLEKYINQGLFIFPCHKNKTPATAQGFYSAVNDAETINKLFSTSDNFLIGLPTGEKNQIAVIDFDVNKKIPGTEDFDTRTVDDLLEEIRTYGEFPDTFQVETPSGGRHFYFLMPEGIDLRSRSRFIDKTLPIDIRANGGYVIAPDGENYLVYDDIDNLEIDNLKSRLRPLPEWIANKRHAESSTPVEMPDMGISENELREIRSALSYISADDYDLWIRVGMSLKSLNARAAFGLWDEWSKTSDKYNPSIMQKKWQQLKPKDIEIASLFFEAKKSGWVTTYEKKEMQQQVQIIEPEIDETQIQIIRETHKKKPFPVHLLQPDGLVGEIANYILEKSIIPQPVFALSAALCAVGVLAGRKIQTPTKIRTNLYCVNVGQSGCGKEAPRQVLKELFIEAGCSNYLGVEELASDTAITTALKGNESRLFLIDEIGRFLSITQGGPSHLSGIISVLLRYYSSADQVVYGKSYADAERNVKLYHPNLCLLGTTVPGNLYTGLTYDNATDGFLSRMLIFETDNNLAKKERDKDFLKKPPKYIIEKMQALREKPIIINRKLGNLDILEPDPLVVQLTADAKKLLIDYDEYIRDLREKLSNEGKIDAIYNRSAQSAEQLALIMAVGNNIDKPIISEKEILYGIELSQHLSDHLFYIVENHMAKNDFEHEVKRILNLVKSTGVMSFSEITKKTQNLSGHVRNDIIETLKESGEIQEYIKILPGNRAKKMIMAIAAAKQIN